MSKSPTKWRTSAQIRGNMIQLIYAINHPVQGPPYRAIIEIDLKIAQNLLEICQQAIHTEDGHLEQP